MMDTAIRAHKTAFKPLLSDHLHTSETMSTHFAGVGILSAFQVVQEHTMVMLQIRLIYRRKISLPLVKWVLRVGRKTSKPAKSSKVSGQLVP